MHKAVEFLKTVVSCDDYVLFINDDCTFNSDYLSRLMLRANTREAIGSFCIDAKNKKTLIDGPSFFDWSNGRLAPKFKNSMFAKLPKKLKFATDSLTTRGVAKSL
jgi:GT2 family glycosyltransferase